MFPKASEAVHASYDRNSPFSDVRQKIKEGRFDEDVKRKFEKLCAYENGTMNYATFKNSSTSCKLVQDGKNPLIRMKIEELSAEPVVQLVHDFVSKEEIEELLKKMSQYEFEIAPTTGEEEEEDSLTSRAATSHYINEKEDNVANIARKLKNR